MPKPSHQTLDSTTTTDITIRTIKQLDITNKTKQRQGIKRDLTTPVLTLKGDKIDDLTLGGDVFDVPIRKDILHQVVRWQLAKRRQGTHKTKTRAEVRGGGRKPHPQKKTGRARAGSIRSPLWRGGGVVFGPVVRSHEHKLNKKVRRLGLKCALSAKSWEGRLLVLDSLKPDSHKTKDMAKVLDYLMQRAPLTREGEQINANPLLQENPRRSVLFVDTAKDGEDGGELLRKSTANLVGVDCIPAEGLNVYSILKRDYLVMSSAAVEAIHERLRKPVRPLRLYGDRVAADDDDDDDDYDSDDEEEEEEEDNESDEEEEEGKMSK
jgi:large subunit ribosomal protein L4